MKKLFRNAMMLSAMAGTLFFTACDNDEDVLPDGPNVSVEVENEQDVYNAGDRINLDVNFTASSNIVGGSLDVTSGDNSYDVTINNGGVVSNVIDLNFFEVTSTQEGSFTISGFPIPDQAANSTLTITVSIEDGDGNVGEGTVNLEIVDSQPIQFYEQVLFGAQGSDEPSFYDALDNDRFGFAGARDASTTESSPIDFAYYYGNTNKNTIASIDSDGLNAAFVATNPDLSIANTFGTRNSTRFRVTDLSPADFEAINSNASLISDADSELNSNVAATELVVGSVVAFKLDEDRGGYVGLIHVTAINDTNGNGTITIEVKVQEASE